MRKIKTAIVENVPYHNLCYNQHLKTYKRKPKQ